MFLEMPVPEARHLPKFRKDFAAAEIRIGVNEFNCIGVSPPDDHPHVYVAMGSNDTALCPYCSTLYRYDQSLGPSEAEPADCFYIDPVAEARSELLFI